jgi:type VI secretion system protein VasD
MSQPQGRVRSRTRWALALAAGIVLAAGCATGAAILEGAIRVDQNANPDVNGRPSPIVVRVYELRALAAFNGADFFSLFDRETETLGADLVGREEYQLRPAETVPYQRQLQPDTKFMAVVAAFRDLEHAHWREVAPVPDKRSATVTIGVDARRVTVSLK